VLLSSSIPFPSALRCQAEGRQGFRISQTKEGESFNARSPTNRRTSPLPSLQASSRAWLPAGHDGRLNRAEYELMVARPPDRRASAPKSSVAGR
jgi:hypothetical protein